MFPDEKSPFTTKFDAGELLEFGVNVYVVVAVLFKAGDQVPLILFSDVVGSGAKVSPEHIAGIGLNVGTTLGIIVIVNVAVLAH